MIITMAMSVMIIFAYSLLQFHYISIINVKHLSIMIKKPPNITYLWRSTCRIDSSPRKVQTKCRSFLAASTLIHRRLAWETWGLAKVICCWESNLGWNILLSWNYQLKEIDVFCLQLQVVWTSDPISGSYFWFPNTFLVIPLRTLTVTLFLFFPYKQSVCFHQNMFAMILGSCLPKESHGTWKNWGTKKKHPK